MLTELLPQPGSAAWERRVDQLAHALASLPDGAHALALSPAACIAALLQVGPMCCNPSHPSSVLLYVSKEVDHAVSPSRNSCIHTDCCR